MRQEVRQEVDNTSAHERREEGKTKQTMFRNIVFRWGRPVLHCLNYMYKYIGSYMYMYMYIYMYIHVHNTLALRKLKAKER